jgi:hypothetical protein
LIGPVGLLFGGLVLFGAVWGARGWAGLIGGVGLLFAGLGLAVAAAWVCLIGVASWMLAEPGSLGLSRS